MVTIYERLGDAHLEMLVDKFYDKVYSDERISLLFQNDIKEVKAKQFKFLTQFFGGPPRYTEVHGHPRLRMRHIPHKITIEAAGAWLECMAQAISELPIEESFKEEIFQRFPPPARHMVNTESTNA